MLISEENSSLIELLKYSFKFLFVRFCLLFCVLIEWLSYRFYITLCHGETYGYDIIERNFTSGFILVANHGSYLDFLVLFSLLKKKYGKQIHFFTTDKLRKHPIFFTCVYGRGAIFVSNSKPRISIEGRKQIKEYKYIGVFPEGTRSRSGKLLASSTGALIYSIEKQVPIIPCTLVGFYDAWPPQKYFPRPKKLKIIFHNEIYYYKNFNGTTPDKDLLKSDIQIIMHSIYNCKNKEEINVS